MNALKRHRQKYEMMGETWMTCLSVWTSCLSEPQRTPDCGYSQTAHVPLLKVSPSLLMCIWQYLWFFFFFFLRWKQINQTCEVRSLCHSSLCSMNCQLHHSWQRCDLHWMWSRWVCLHAHQSHSFQSQGMTCAWKWVTGFFTSFYILLRHILQRRGSSQHSGFWSSACMCV